MDPYPPSDEQMEASKLAHPEYWDPDLPPPLQVVVGPGEVKSYSLHQNQLFFDVAIMNYPGLYYFPPQKDHDGLRSMLLCMKWHACCNSADLGGIHMLQR